MTEPRGSVAAPDRSSPRPAAAGSGRGSRRGNPFARIALFWKQMIAELRKVIWPNRRELLTYTTVSVVFVSVMVAIVALFDVVFAKGVLEVFG